MTDPYKVLGVSPNASEDEIKQAYRTLAKKYHPDNYVDNPLSELAAEKMKEINEAYDTITKSRPSGSNDGGPSSESSTSPEYTRIRNLINSNRVGEAEVLLSRIPTSDRKAEWYFLYGHVYYKKGWMADARNHFETACRMDPYNTEYRATLERMGKGSAQSPYGGNTSSRGCDCSGCDICSSLICADCCCECMGGDLIPCC